ncbi:hypothetical protein ACSDBR_09955 [Acidithiobacillus ferriphilus]|uniref:hypothetical protein n=1 Tax=Acidithiobacillus ferriphilus TaxID=1689834 RepID=UPI003F518771
MKAEIRERALRILRDPSRYLPLLFTVYSIDPEIQEADWLAASLGDEAEMFVKRLLVEGFYRTRETDLVAYARRRVLEEDPHANE